MKRILLALLILGALGLVYRQLDGGDAAALQPSATGAATAARSELSASDDELLAPGALENLAEERESIRVGEPVDARVAYAVQVVLQSQDLFKSPVAGVQVQLGVAFGVKRANGPLREGKVLLAETTVDEEGRALVELLVPQELLERASAENKETLYIWGSVSESGYRHRSARWILPTDPQELVTLRLRCDVGRTIYGRLLLEDGSPVPTGMAFLCRVDDELRPTRTLNHKPVDSDGYFTMHIKRTGRLAIHAQAFGFGAVTSDLLEFDHDEPLELELTVLGSAVIAGRVVGEDGKAYPNYSLAISPFEAQPVRPNVSGYLKRVLTQWDGGLRSYSIMTDEDGVFRFGGLQTGAYKIRGLDPTTGVHNVSLTNGPVQTDRFDLEFVVSGCRLLVHVLDWEGKPLKRLNLAHRSSRLLDMYMLYCEPCDASGRLLSLGTSKSQGRSRLEDGAVVLDVEGGKSYVVGVASSFNQLEELVVHIPLGELHSERTLRLRAPPSDTRFSVNVLDPSGQPYMGTVHVRVLAPGSGRQLLENSIHSGTSQTQLLGPGLYMLQVSAESLKGFYGDILSTAPHAMAEELVELRAGQENIFEVRLKPAGKMEILVGCGTEFPEPSVYFFARVAPAERDVFRMSKGRGALVRLESVDSGAVIRLSFVVKKNTGPSGSGYDVEKSWLPIGEGAKTTAPIPIGEYDLVISPPGFREFRERVTIDAGIVTKLEFTLTQQDLLD